MDSAAKLAGFFAAHGIWCVSDGEVLVPLMGTEATDGTRKMVRFANEKVDQGVAEGKEKLSENPEGAALAVLVYDGFVKYEGGKMDALLVDFRLYGPEPRSVLMAVPYRPAGEPKGFAVHRPKFLSFEGQEPDFEAVGKAFFEGVDCHERGATVWTENLDESQ
jgi:hypothetical protein